jgi:hypothetical protein
MICFGPSTDDELLSVLAVLPIDRLALHGVQVLFELLVG